MKYADRNWKPFRMGAILDIMPGKRLEKINMVPGNTPFIGSSDRNNGVTAFCGNKNESLDANVLGLNYNGSVCEAFYHPYQCLFSDDVKRLKLKYTQKNNKYVLLFVGTCIRQQKIKYMYSYKFNEKRMLSQSILLPAQSNGEPDYDFMEAYVKEMMIKKIAAYRDYVIRQIKLGGGAKCPECDDWKPFKIGELFRIKRPVSRSQKQYEEGKIPFVASGTVNNGVVKYCKIKDDEMTDRGNCITISPVDGSAFYQPIDFLGRGGGGSSILLLYNNMLNRFNGVFLSRVLSWSCEKYSYGRMGNSQGTQNKTVLLPATSLNQPDWEFMEAYGRQMMLKKYQQYWDFLDRMNR